MQQANKRAILVTAIVAWATLIAIGFVLSKPDDQPASWKPAVEGFLAIPTPCCTDASLWDALDEVTPDGQRARPASAREAARWVDKWPYRRDVGHDAPDGDQPKVAIENTEVRCVGTPSGPELAPRKGYAEETLRALRHRRECVYTKWRVWREGTEREHLKVRHTVWVDEDGFFHGRVDYWR